MRPVQIGEKTGNRYILKSGLKAGDRIAVSSIDQLTESMTVAPSMVDDKF
jgi:membrane fusion protein (multidrug efflux system)